MNPPVETMRLLARSQKSISPTVLQCTGKSQKNLYLQLTHLQLGGGRHGEKEEEEEKEEKV